MPRSPYASRINPHIMAQVEAAYIEHGSPAALQVLASYGIAMPRGTFREYVRRYGWQTKARGGPGSYAWTADDVAYLRATWPDDTIPSQVICEHLGRSYNAVSQKAGALGLSRFPESPMEDVRYLVPNLQIDKPLLVIADLHVPFQNAEWMERVVDLAVAWGGEAVLLAGDAIDAQGASRFERFDSPSISEEKAAWRAVEAHLVEQFGQVYWMLGNHEARLAKAIDFKIPLVDMVRDHFVQAKDRVQVMDSFACTVNDRWRIEHPKAAGSMVALDLVARHNMNVAVAHTHHASISRDPSGRFFGIRIGAGCDHDRMRYCTRITHAKYAMTNGALILVPTSRGEVVPYNLEPEMDLEAMKAMYSYGSFHRRTARVGA